MPKYEGEMPLGDTEADYSPSGFNVGLETAQLSYGEDVGREAYTNITKSYPDYKDNQEAYDAFSEIDSFMGTDEDARRHTRYGIALREGYFELDEENNIVEGSNYFTGASLLYNMDIVKGALLAKKNGFTEESLNLEYSKVTKEKASRLSMQKDEVSNWGYIPGLLAGHIAQPETAIDFMSPSKVMGTTVTKGAIKAFGVEAGVALVGETMREQRIREHMEKANLDYTLWDSVENILIGAGFAGFLRGVGSAVTDKITFNKIHEGITNKTDKEIFARFARRENYKLTTNSTKHLAVLEKAREDIDAGRQVDIADHTDININTKTDDAVEEVSLSEEVKASSNIDPEEIKHFEEAIDNPPPVKDTTEADPYEGMATPKEADETIMEVMDDPEIKAMFDEIEVEKQRLSPQAQMAKEAKEPTIGGSEDEAKQAVKDLFKKQQQEEFKNYSAEDIDEMDRLFKEDQELTAMKADSAGIGGQPVFAQFGPELFVGGIAGVGEDEEGNLTFDPAKFIMGMLAAHGAKFAVMKTNAFIEPGLKPKQKAAADKAIKKMQSKAAEAILMKDLAKDVDPKLIKQLKEITEKSKAK